MTRAAHSPAAPVGRQGPPTRAAAPAVKALRAARGSLLSTTGTAPSRLTPTQNLKSADEPDGALMPAPRWSRSIVTGGRDGSE